MDQRMKTDKKLQNDIAFKQTFGKCHYLRLEF